MLQALLRNTRFWLFTGRMHAERRKLIAGSLNVAAAREWSLPPSHKRKVSKRYFALRPNREAEHLTRAMLFSSRRDVFLPSIHARRRRAGRLSSLAHRAVALAPSMGRG